MGLSGKEHVILALLRDGREEYGLRLVSASDGDLKRGTVYVTVARMEEKGRVGSRHEPRRQDASGMPRRLYHATAEGMVALRESEERACRLAEPRVRELRGQA